MRRAAFISSAIFALIQLILGFVLTPPSLAQEWKIRGKPRGPLRVVEQLDEKR